MIEQEAVTILLQKETGGRSVGTKTMRFLLFITLIWSIFQIWVASPLQFILAEYLEANWIILNDSKQRMVHLSFALFLSFTFFPAFKNSSKNTIPLLDWIISILSIACILYNFVLYENIANRIGYTTNLDAAIALSGIALLLEATRRLVGPTMVIIALFFLAYTIWGQYFPDVVAHRGHSIYSLSAQQWFSNEGVFGVALGVTSNFVFLYVLFGALLDKVGAGSFFIKLSFALFAHLRGGIAKAAIVASGLMGMMSGSSIANTVTVGSLTIPLMKRAGFSAEQSGAIEVSAGINGQIMPPVMGAAAFLMSEFTSVPYTQIMKHAIVPAVLVYLALLYIVHLEALKMNMHVSERKSSHPWYINILLSLVSLLSIFITCALVYFLIEGIRSSATIFFPGIKAIFGSNYVYVITSLLCLTYIFLLYINSEYVDTTEAHKNDSMPDNKGILRSGLHYLLALFILVWNLIVERQSPGLSAFWAIMFLCFMIISQKFLVNLFRTKKISLADLKSGFVSLSEAMISGARNTLAISVATATAGIIVGSVSLTGIGQIMTEIVDFFSGGNLFITLVLTALICIILGMGMPTTACYIIVSSLMVPVINHAMINNGFNVPIVAIHLFVFYFGLMADVTPPIGLASYAAAAISKGSPMKTGAIAFLYNIRTMALPFMFLFNNEIILYNISNFWHGLFTILLSITGIILFSAATQGYFLTKNKLYESLLLLLISITVLYPKFWIDIIYPRFEIINNKALDMPLSRDYIFDGVKFRLKLQTINQLGDKNDVFLYIDLITLTDKKTNSVLETIRDSGVDIRADSKNRLTVAHISNKVHNLKSLLDVGSQIDEICISRKQPNKNLPLIPATVSVLLVYYLQKIRIYKTKNHV
jgi:TRAP transporter 4TM/12TM fusion protein